MRDFYKAEGSGGNPATLLLPGVNGKSYFIEKIWVGYDGTPAAGCEITITDGYGTFSMPITASGPAPMDIGGECMAGYGISITLSGGGGSVTATLNAKISSVAR